MKIRVTITTTYEFEPDANNYPKGDVVEILALEKLNAEEDPYLYMDLKEANTEVKTEVIGD